MSDPSLPNRRPARAAGKAALEGEVLPPSLRVVNPPPPQDDARPAELPRSRLRAQLVTAALAVALLASAGGAGAFGAYAWRHRAAPANPQAGAATLALTRLSTEMAELKAAVAAVRQDDAARALKKGVDQLRAELDSLRTADATAIAQLNGKLDKPAAATTPAMADVAARLDKLDHDPRLADIAARLDRIERQVSAPAATGSIAAPAVHAAAAQTVVSQSSAQAKPPVRPVVLDNWIVRDVYSGIALVEGRSGSVREVVPGEVLPGAGEVRAIERHGRGWVVVTSRGVIDTATW